MQVTMDFIHSNEDLPIMVSAVNKVFTYSELLSIIITYKVLEGEGSILPSWPVVAANCPCFQSLAHIPHSQLQMFRARLT